MNNPYHQNSGYFPAGHDTDGGDIGTADSSNRNVGQGSQKISKDSHHSLTPVTIRQLLNAKQEKNEDEYLVDNKKLSLITVVGVIMVVKDVTNQLRLEIDDGTARIDVYQFLDTGDAVTTSWREGTYIRIIGHLRTFQLFRTILAIRIHPINFSKFNEITYHFLEVIYVHLYHTNGGSKISGQSLPPLVNALPSGLTELQNSILSVLSGASHQDGTSSDFIKSALNRYGDGQQINEALNQLSMKGWIQNTEDEYHWKLNQQNL